MSKKQNQKMLKNAKRIENALNKKTTQRNRKNLDKVQVQVQAQAQVLNKRRKCLKK